MPKPQFLTLPRPEALRATKEFVDPKYPNDIITLTVGVSGDVAESNETTIKAQELYYDFGPKDQKGKLNVPLFWDNEPLEVDFGLCQEIASIMVVDVSPPEEKLDFHEWVIAATGRRDMFMSAWLWVHDIVTNREIPQDNEEVDEAPNGSAAPGDSTSAAPQNII